MQHRSFYTCDICDFSTQNEMNMKRHTRDTHNILTKSTSPQSKKKRFQEPNEYKTNASEQVVAELSDNMEGMDIEENIQAEKSLMKNKEKIAKIETEFKQFKFQKERYGN